MVQQGRNTLYIFLMPAPCMDRSGLSRPHPFCRLGTCPGRVILPASARGNRSSNVVAVPACFDSLSKQSSRLRPSIPRAAVDWTAFLCPSLPVRVGSPLGKLTALRSLFVVLAARGFFLVASE